MSDDEDDFVNGIALPSNGVNETRWWMNRLVSNQFEKNNTEIVTFWRTYVVIWVSRCFARKSPTTHIATDDRFNNEQQTTTRQINEAKKSDVIYAETVPQCFTHNEQNCIGIASFVMLLSFHSTRFLSLFFIFFFFVLQNRRSDDDEVWAKSTRCSGDIRRIVRLNYRFALWNHTIHAVFNK